MNPIRTSALFVLAALATVPATASAQKKDKPFRLPENVELVRDVEFGKGGGRPLTMHLLKPKQTSAEPMPVVVWIHGGGWQGGNKDSGLGRLAPLAARGFFCATVEYRPSGEAPFPAQIEDCKCAIRFLRAKAKQWNIDPERIGVWGSSAGGHLVALLGTSAHVKELEGKGGWGDQSSRVRAVCDFCGPTDLVKIVGDSKNASSPVMKLLGGHPTEKRDLADLANPINHITKDTAAFLIVHGDQDKTVPLSQSELLTVALKKAGVRVELFVARGQGHGLGGPEIQQTVVNFFEKELK